MKPFFSIIIAVYNREELVSRAIESVLNQDTENWELINIDDCSTDNTKSVITPFLVDNRFRYFKTDNNSGVAKARNLGISKANGKYITFLDSDDEYKTVHLSKRFELLKDNKIDLLHGGVEIIGNSKVPDKNNIEKMIELSECVIGGTFFINSNLDNKILLFDENVDYSEDSKMYEEFEKRKLNIVKTEYQTYIYYRDTPDSICNTVSK